ncbi:hypothetical protein BDA96_01G434300 [Sorghum bicolor]|uniref:Uncharacterized protein n=1 Tax=Sorghum bicolor TaxID=4558 RepID=A0A921V1C3_SORBI|nr:hypothetical protein BDA96_01G434300 [Sorghum bicolor]
MKEILPGGHPRGVIQPPRVLPNPLGGPTTAPIQMADMHWTRI